MGWLIFQNESLVSSLLATTGIGQAGLQREEPYRCRAMALVTRRAGTLTRSAPCVKKSPGFLKKLGPELDSMRPLNSPVSPLVPNRASCIWFRAFPNLCRGIVSERLGHLDPWTLFFLVNSLKAPGSSQGLSLLFVDRRVPNQAVSAALVSCHDAPSEPRCGKPPARRLAPAARGAYAIRALPQWGGWGGWG
jgi:hypothetical protein